MAEEAVLAISEYLVDTGIATYGITAAEAAYIVAAIEIVTPVYSQRTQAPSSIRSSMSPRKAM